MKEFPEGYHFTRRHDFEVKIKRKDGHSPFGGTASFQEDEKKLFSYIYVWSLDENEEKPQFTFITEKMIGDATSGHSKAPPTSHAIMVLKDKKVYLRHDNNPHRQVTMDGDRAEAFLKAYEVWRTYSIILGGDE